MGSHIQEYLAGLGAEREERLARWTRGIQNELEKENALRLFPAELAALLGGMELVLGSDPIIRGQLKQGSKAPATTDMRQSAECRDTSPASETPWNSRTFERHFVLDSKPKHAFRWGRDGCGCRRQRRGECLLLLGAGWNLTGGLDGPCQSIRGSNKEGAL